MFKKTILVVIAVLLIFSLGILVGAVINKKTSSSSPQKSENTFQAGWDAAKKRLQERGGGIYSVGMEIKSISGTVQKISGNTIVLTSVSTPDPLSDPALDTRTVQINKDTRIIQIVQKDPQQFQQEMEEFQKKMQEQGGDISEQLLLDPIQIQQEQKDATIADIKEGQSISVSANENIESKKEFVAAEVSF